MSDSSSQTVCPICGPSVSVVLFGEARVGSLKDPARVRYVPRSTVLCERCGLLYRFPPTADDFYHDGYYEAKGQPGEADLQRSRLRERRRLERLRQLVRFEGMRVLDAGCGRAMLLDEIVKTAAPTSAVGIEPSGKVAAWAREQSYPFPVHAMSVREFAESGMAQAFDVVLLVGVLEHFGDPLADLRRLRTLQPDGAQLYIYTHDESPVLGWDPRERISLVHVLYFIPRTIGALLEQAGYRVTHLESRGTSMDLVAEASGSVSRHAPLSPRETAALIRQYRAAGSTGRRLARSALRGLRVPLRYAGAVRRKLAGLSR